MILLLFACSAQDSDSAAACGDSADWSGLPDVSGEWTTSFGNDFFDSQCEVEGLTAASESWIAAFTVKGSPPSTLWGYFGLDDSERFEGAIDQNGGVSFTGTHPHDAGTLHANFAGLAYEDQYQGDTLTIDGAAFLGLDADGDQRIDCYARGSWGAKKSQ